MLRTVLPTDVALLRSLATLEASCTQGDLLDGIVVGLSVLSDAVHTAKYERRMFVLTNAECPMNESDQLPEIVERFKALSCKLDVV